MPKNKTHNGLRKRVRVTKTGKVKVQRACGRHLRSHKSGSTVRKYRRPKYAGGPEAKRLARMLRLKASGSRNPAVGQVEAESQTSTESEPSALGV